MRLGGIYALEGVMNMSEQYHQPVLEALCAFVREEAKGEPDNAKAPAADIQAALAVIGRRKPGPGGANLDGAKIPGAILRYADLSNASLIGVDLQGADLTRR